MSERLYFFCGKFPGWYFMQQFLKPSEGTEESTYETTKQDSQHHEKACHIKRDSEFRRTWDCLQSSYRTGSRCGRARIAVEARYAEFFQISLIDSSFRQVQQEKIWQKNCWCLYPRSCWWNEPGQRTCYATPVSYTHLDVYKRQAGVHGMSHLMDDRENIL